MHLVNSMRFAALHKHAFYSMPCTPSRFSPPLVPAATTPSAVESTEPQELFSDALKLDRFTDSKYVEKMRSEAAEVRPSVVLV